MKTPKERDTRDLIELVLQLHTRAHIINTKEMHDAYVEANNELLSRFDQSKEKTYSKEDMRFISTRFAHHCRLKNPITNHETVDLYDSWIDYDTIPK